MTTPPDLKELAATIRQAATAAPTIASIENARLLPLLDALEEAQKRLGELVVLAKRTQAGIVDYARMSAETDKSGRKYVAGLTAERDRLKAEVEQKQRELKMQDTLGRSIIDSLTADRDALKAEMEEAREMFLDLFRHACGTCTTTASTSGVIGQTWSYDCMAIRTYRDVQEHLIQWGLVKPEECVRK